MQSFSDDGCPLRSNGPLIERKSDAEISATVKVTLRNLAGDALARDVTTLVTPSLQIGKFVRSLLDHLTPPSSGYYFAFSSTCFSQVLTERREDPATGLTQENETLLTSVFVTPLHDEDCIDLQVTTVTSELRFVQAEEKGAYRDIISQAIKTEGPYERYDQDLDWLEERENDLMKARMDESSRFAQVMEHAEYVCPFAATPMSAASRCDYTCKLREDLVDHLQSSHSEDYMRLEPSTSRCQNSPADEIICRVV
eukprot:TRINITY_DN43425_c0_g1_i1.p1 TRINITY_DN43425_c0_g1~~TRINITY_DN43425_c0_g1_i1.p1  ORF type:complete len:254 (-),score=36.54 TRINITY_DN43425_c0_g1_i1:76-837(-)